MTDNNFFNLGVKLASVSLGRKPEDLVAVSALVETVDNVKESNYGYLQKFICKAAADCFAEIGRMDELEYHIYEKLASTPNWFPELDAFSDAAFVAFGKIALEHENAVKEATADGVVKNSNVLLGSVSKLLGGVAKATPEVIATMAGAGAIGGSALGGLYWLLNRHGLEDEADAEAMKAKIDYYNKVTNEIKSQLGNKKLPPAELASRVADVMQDQNLF